MAKLIKCKACGAEISKNAKECPHCGEPVPKGTSLFTWFILIVLIFAFIGNLLPESSNYSSSTTTSTTYTPPIKPTQAQIEKKQKIIEEEIKYFKQSKEKIIDDIELKIKNKKYVDASKITTKYSQLKGEDENISQLHTKIVALIQKEQKEKEAKYKKEILKELKSLPASEYAKNKELYQTLLKYEPNNKKYKQKVEFYTKKIEKDKEDQRLVRLGLKWRYQESKDKMGRGTIKNALVDSANQLSFDFPYQGLQKATLQLRKHPKYGKDVIVSIEKGQFLCSYNGCRVSVRFDNGKPIRYNVSEPSDHSSTYIFINDYTSFVKRAKKSKEIYIEAEFYQEGRRVMEFNSEGLKF